MNTVAFSRVSGDTGTKAKRAALLIALGFLAQACLEPSYQVSQDELAQGSTSSSSSGAISETNGTCALSVSDGSPTIGQSVTYSLQSFPFGPTIKACLYGSLNGTQDMNCADSNPTGPSQYQVSLTLTLADVGTETRYAEVFDESGDILCTTNTVTLLVSSTGVSSSSGGGGNPPPLGGSAAQPCYTGLAGNPQLFVGGTTGIGVYSMLSTQDANLAVCWYGTINGSPIPDCWIPPQANGTPNPSPASMPSATSPTGTVTGWPFYFMANSAGSYSLYAKIIATSNGTVTNVATNAPQTVTAGQVVCETQANPLSFNVAAATCQLSSDKTIYAQGQAPTWKIAAQEGTTLTPHYTQTANNLPACGQNQTPGNTVCSLDAIAYPGNSWTWGGGLYDFTDPAFTGADAGVLDRTAILRDSMGNDACVSNTVEIVVNPAVDTCALTVNQSSFSVAAQQTPMFTVTTSGTNLQAYWYGSFNGGPDALGASAGTVNANGTLSLVEPPYSAAQIGTYTRYLLLMQPSQSGGAPTPVCVTPPVTIQVNP